MPRSTHTLVAIAAVAALALALPAPASAAVGGTITGTVTASDSLSGIESAYVTAFASNGRVGGHAVTNASGDYTIASLPAGDYTLQFQQISPNHTYAAEWHGDTPFESGAVPVPVTEGGAVDIDAALSPGGFITGTASGADTAGGYMVRAFAWDDATDTWVEMGVQHGAVPPSYVIGALPGGLSYRLWFQHFYSTTTYASMFYPSQTTIATATDIPVTSGATVTNINQTLAPGGPLPSDRYAGADRFATSAQIALNYDSTTTDTVFLASGLGYPDALSAGPAAAAFDAPLLLTLPDSIPPAVATQIDRIDPAKIVVVGGTAIVTPAVISQLEALVPGVDVERIAGADRYETSRKLADYAFGETGAEFAYISTGVNFPDALSAAAAGGANGAPVILVYGPGTTVDTPTRDLIADLDIDILSITGGTATVSQGIENILKTLPGVQGVDRLAGADRYQTSSMINQHYSTVPADKVYLAVGTSFADALSGAALAARDGAPLFVVPGNCVPAQVRQQIYVMSAQEVVLLGGTAVLGTGVQNLTPC